MSGPLPPSPAPRGNYRPAVAAAGLIWSAGMTPRVGGELAVAGRLGEDLELEDGRRAAGLAARNAVAAVAELAGGLERIAALVSLTVYVACVPGFEQLSAVADGASDELALLLPSSGAAARAAIGVQSLPGGAPVEVQLVAAAGEAGTPG